MKQAPALFIFIFFSVDLFSQVIIVNAACKLNLPDTLYKNNYSSVSFGCDCKVKEANISIVNARGKTMADFTDPDPGSSFEWDYRKLHRGYYYWSIEFTVDYKGKEQKRVQNGTILLLEKRH